MWGEILTSSNLASLQPLRDKHVSLTDVTELAEFHSELLSELSDGVITDVRVGTDERSHFGGGYIHLNPDEAADAPGGMEVEMFHAGFWHEFAHFLSYGPLPKLKVGSDEWLAQQLLEDLRAEALLATVADDPAEDDDVRWLRFNTLGRIETDAALEKLAGRLGWADLLTTICGRHTGRVITEEQAKLLWAKAPALPEVEGIVEIWETYIGLPNDQLETGDAKECTARLGEMIAATKP